MTSRKLVKFHAENVGAALTTRLLIMLIVVQLFCSFAFGQQTTVLLNDSTVLVTQIAVSPGETYSLPRDQVGTVWVVLDPATLLMKSNETQSKKQVPAGEAEVVKAGKSLEFQVPTAARLRLVVVKPKATSQELTVGPFLASGSLDDASDRNATLLVAVSTSRFRDIRNLGNESEWIPSKPNVVIMKAGSVRWVRPGIHHFKNLSPLPAKLISIEW